VRALTTYCGHIATGGWRNRRLVDLLLQKAELAAQIDGRPYARACVSMAKGVAAHLQSRYAESVRHCDEAVASLLDGRSQSDDDRCRDASWEQALARSIAMWSLMYMGRIDELAQRQPILSRMAEESNDLFATLNFGTQIRTFYLLGSDQPGEALRCLEFDARRLSTQGFFVQHQNYLLARAFVEQYCGCGAAAWQALQDSLGWSTLRLVQHMRIDYFQARCRAALAAGSQASGRDRRRLLREARHAERKLRAEKTPWTAAVSSVLQAAIAAAEGRADVRQLLSSAVDQLSAVDGLLLAAAARVRLAQVEGREEGDAAARMQALGVVNVGRMTSALLPGFD
jgi:hypothetical protein